MRVNELNFNAVPIAVSILVLVVVLGILSLRRDPYARRLNARESRRLEALAADSTEVREYLTKYVQPGQSLTRMNLEKAESIVAMKPLRDMLSGQTADR